MKTISDIAQSEPLTTLIVVGNYKETEPDAIHWLDDHPFPWHCPPWLLSVPETPALAQIAGCPDALGDRADTAVAGVTTWSAFADWYRRYAVCDDGDTAEGMDSMTAKLLSERWGELMQAGSRFRNDPGLRHFLVRHINAVGLSRDSAIALEERAKARCSPPNAAFCGAIAQAAKTTVLENTPQ